MSSEYYLQKQSGIVDLLAIHERSPDDFPFLLESVASGENNCRYDILFAYPQANISLVELGKLLTSNVSGVEKSSFLDALNSWFSQERQNVPAEISQQFPFYGGWFVYLGYSLAAEIEPVVELSAKHQSALPIALASRIPAAIIIDKQKKQTWTIVEPGYECLIAPLQRDVGHQLSAQQRTQQFTAMTIDYQLCEENPRQYLTAVKRIQQYIIEGDVFQVNVSRLWQLKLEKEYSPAQLYRRLRTSNPAPFAGLMNLGDVSVISSSPERLVSVQSNVIETRPIAGTRPRRRDVNGKIDQVADQALREELISHPKERAEHVMLIDLERNDLGRIAVPGSVKVDELMVVESYEHVHHIVSNVRAELRPECGPGDVIRAVFPGGTITGCPKVRCMQIIEELESSPREAYTGSMGYLNIDGSMDLNILIRSIIQSGKQLHIRAGAGIVAYSDPQKELEETRVKAKGMLNAVVNQRQV